MNFRTAFLVIVALLITCENPTISDTELAYSSAIGFRLISGYSTQLGAVLKAHKYTTNNPPVVYNPVRKEYINNATVQVNSILYESVPVGESGFNFKCDSLVVIPGNSYKITVYTENESISGMTTVPGSFRFESFDQDFKWSPGTGASYYQICIEKLKSDSSGIDRSAIKYYKFCDTTTEPYYDSDLIKDDLDFKNIQLPGLFKITVYAYDQNIFNYVHAGSQSAGIDNAYGYFGSITQTDTILTLDF